MLCMVLLSSTELQYRPSLAGARRPQHKDEDKRGCSRMGGVIYYLATTHLICSLVLLLTTPSACIVISLVGALVGLPLAVFPMAASQVAPLALALVVHFESFYSPYPYLSIFVEILPPLAPWRGASTNRHHPSYFLARSTHSAHPTLNTSEET